MRDMRTTSSRNGASLIEVLLGIIIVVIASVGTLTYFAYGMGNVGKSGKRRAALERARERLEQVMEANSDDIKPAADGQMYELFCGVTNPCTWTLSAAPVTIPTLTKEPTVVDGLPSQIATTIQWRDDPSAGTATLDTLELGVRVWFTSNTSADDNLNRVHIRTLRTTP